jgi:hypothetical protein
MAARPRPDSGRPARRRSTAFRDGWTVWRRRASRNPAAPRNAVSPWEVGAPRSAASRWEAAANPWLGATARCSRTGSSNPSPSSEESCELRNQYAPRPRIGKLILPCLSRHGNPHQRPSGPAPAWNARIPLVFAQQHEPSPWLPPPLVRPGDRLGLGRERRGRACQLPQVPDGVEVIVS